MTMLWFLIDFVEVGSPVEEMIGLARDIIKRGEKYNLWHTEKGNFIFLMILNINNIKWVQQIIILKILSSLCVYYNFTIDSSLKFNFINLEYKPKVLQKVKFFFF